MPTKDTTKSTTSREAPSKKPLGVLDKEVTKSTNLREATFKKPLGISNKEVTTKDKPISKTSVLQKKIPISKNTPKPNPTPTVKPTPQRVNYRYAGKESIEEALRKAVPEQLIPTKRMASIFGIIFLVVLVIAAFQFPLASMLSGNVNVTIGVGYPWTFLELELIPTDAPPIKTAGFIYDLLLYIFLAYVIDILINLITKNPLLRSEEENKKRPVIFKNKDPSIAEKVTQKVIEKTIKKEPQNQIQNKKIAISKKIQKP